MQPWRGDGPRSCICGRECLDSNRISLWGVVLVLAVTWPTLAQHLHDRKTSNGSAESETFERPGLDVQTVSARSHIHSPAVGLSARWSNDSVRPRTCMTAASLSEPSTRSGSEATARTGRTGQAPRRGLDIESRRDILEDLTTDAAHDHNGQAATDISSWCACRWTSTLTGDDADSSKNRRDRADMTSWRIISEFWPTTLGATALHTLTLSLLSMLP